MGGPEGLFVAEQLGEGQLLAPETYGVGGSTLRPRLGRFHDEEALQIVAAGDEALVALQIAKGSVLGEKWRVPIASQPRNVWVANWDRNDQLDVLLAYENPARTVVVRDPAENRPSTPEALSRSVILAEDLNGDNDLDLLTSEGLTQIKVLAGSGTLLLESGEFDLEPNQKAGAGDFDGDRRADLFFVSASGVSIAWNQSPLVGDADGDGHVGLADFAAVKQNFGSSGGRSEGDFDGDGHVELADWQLMLSRFGDRVRAR
jgi:hypothetical protein